MRELLESRTYPKGDVDEKTRVGRDVEIWEDELSRSQMRRRDSEGFDDDEKEPLGRGVSKP